MNKCYICGQQIPDTLKEVIKGDKVLRSYTEGEKLDKREEVMEYTPDICNEKNCREQYSYDQDMNALQHIVDQGRAFGDGSFYG